MPPDASPARSWHPAFWQAIQYTSPKIKLNNRVLESTVAEKAGSKETAAGEPAKKSKFAMRALGTAAALANGGSIGDAVRGGQAPAQLPEMQNENCAPKGSPLTLDQVTAVGRNGFGESNLGSAR